MFAKPPRVETWRRSFLCKKLGLEDAAFFFDLEGENGIAWLDFGGGVDGEAAFVATSDFVSVLFVLLEIGEATGADDLAVALDFNLRAFHDFAVIYATADDHVVFAGFEDGEHGESAEIGADHFGWEEGGEALFHIFDKLVDDIKAFDIDTCRFGDTGGNGGWVHIEADNERAGGSCNANVAFGDTADAFGDDVDHDFVRGNGPEDLFDGLERSVHVGFDEEGEFRYVVVGNHLHVFFGGATGHAFTRLESGGDFAAHNLNNVVGVGRGAQTVELNRR